ncbi:MAG: GNAT family N-acetyltransferase [Chloroflexi bacterium]|nr:GNAT family N-acetyltransferase [Chloroflexota bacterium]
MDVIKTQTRYLVRSAKGDDFQQLAGLTHFGAYVHYHLGWASPLDWLGKDPYLVLEKEGRIVAAIACPEDYQGVAWLQFFAVSQGVSVEESWELLWPGVLNGLDDDISVLALPIQRWFRRLLQSKDFVKFDDVILLAWKHENRHYQAPLHKPIYRVRPMKFDDLGAIQALDNEAFDPVWRHSMTVIEAIFRDVKIATVIEDHKGILGYQMSTEHIERGHLARLAVHPRAQRSGVGTELVLDLIQKFKSRGISHITVNTQVDNKGSQVLYYKLGFKNTDEIYTAYQARV